MAKFTRTQLLARSVNANVVFFRFGRDDSASDPIVAVLRDTSDISTFAASHGREIHYPDVYWQAIPLRGPELPYSAWPDLKAVYLVTEGGIGDAAGDTEIDPVALAVFVDRAGAEQFAAAEDNPNVVVREVPLDRTLPIPAGITGGALAY